MRRGEDRTAEELAAARARELESLLGMPPEECPVDRVFALACSLFLGALTRKAHGVLRDLAEAEDVVQTGLVKARRSFHSFRPSQRLCPVDAFFFWIRRIVTNAAIDEYRRKKRRLERNGETPDRAGRRADPPHEPARHGAGERARKFREHVVRLAAATLDPVSSDVVRLRLEGGLKFKEIGSQLGIAEGTARVRNFRALRRLRELQEFQRLASEFQNAEDDADDGREETIL